MLYGPEYGLCCYVFFVVMKNLYSIIVACIILLYIYISQISQGDFLCCSIFYILSGFFCPLVTVPERGMLKSPLIILCLSVSPFSFVTFPLYILKLCYLVHSNLGLLYLPVDLVFLSLWNVPITSNSFFLKVYFMCWEFIYTSFTLVSICLVSLLSIYFDPICVFIFKICLL